MVIFMLRFGKLFGELKRLTRLQFLVGEPYISSSISGYIVNKGELFCVWSAAPETAERISYDCHIARKEWLLEKVVSLSQSIFDYSFYLEFVEKSKQQVVEESVSTSFQSFSLLLNLPAPLVLTLTRVRNGQFRKVIL
ncbi:hypothetical protein ACLB2K_016542 [Fragaria x ananassa]